MMVEVILGKETRKVPAYKRRNGGYVYWSPFTGERVVIPTLRTGLMKRRRINDRRVAASRRCPDREPRR